MFGRVYVPDERDSFYTGDMIRRNVYGVTSKYWPAPLFEGERDRYSVGAAWYHWWLSNRNKLNPTTHPITPYEFYRAGTSDSYEGSAIRGGARLLRGMKLIHSYYWSTGIDDLTNYLLNFGPAVIGSSWFEGMMEPDRETGYIHVTGENVGQHAYLVDGISVTRGIVRIKNSWGRSWGLEGYGYLPLTDMEKLLAEPTSEGCLVLGHSSRWRVFEKKRNRKRKKAK